MSTETNINRFRIAFSFAGEKRGFVDATARILAQHFGEERILYDKFHEAEFARFDLGIYLPKLYGEQSELIVPVLCDNYDQKRWTGWEWAHIYGLLTNADGHRVMPSRFDYANADGLSPTAGFIELDNKTPEQFATRILERLAINEGKPKDHYTTVDANDAAQAPIANQVDMHHKNYASKSLQSAPHFFQALQQDFENELPDEPVPASVNEIVDYFSACQPEQVQELFYMVRRALKALAEHAIDDFTMKQTCEAASAMYCLAAIRLVDRAAHEIGNTILQVPRSENIICAIIATALFGGKLRLQPTEQSPLPGLEYVFEIQVPACGDHIQLGFERALYTVLFENAMEAGVKTLDNQPLSADELAALSSRLNEIKNVERDCLALIVHGYAGHDSVRPFAQQCQIPVMFPSNQATSLLIGMSADCLKGEISEFWKRVNGMSSSSVISNTPKKSGSENMQNSGFNIHAPGGTVVVSTGANSAAQAGTNNTANTGQQQLADLSSLTAKLDELQAAIAELSSAKAKDKFTGHLQNAQSEITGKAKPDAGIVKQSLEAIKLGGEAVEGGEKIVELCTQALPLLSLLPTLF
ncbi:MAG: hypothetical protein ACXWE9_01150 [Methylobacter sp.]